MELSDKIWRKESPEEALQSLRDRIQKIASKTDTTTGTLPTPKESDKIWTKKSPEERSQSFRDYAQRVTYTFEGTSLERTARKVASSLYNIADEDIGLFCIFSIISVARGMKKIKRKTEKMLPQLKVGHDFYERLTEFMIYRENRELEKRQSLDRITDYQI